ncbi:MAG: NUDIX domain-containing protein, partial [Gemmataceae bacterium]|nr:NUDIX domain-containing protein [Gemmataceae bacterium]
LGAVLSQAFDRRLPIVEANSLRVLCRLYGQEGNVRTGAVRRWLWETAAGLLPRRRVGDFNQALMELGALVCTPTNPRCDRCPWTAFCHARHYGRQHAIPQAAPRPRLQLSAEVGVVAAREDEVFLVQRPEAGRWAHLWEFPHGPLGPDERPRAGARRLLAALTGLRARHLAPLTTVCHSIMRQRVRLECFLATQVSGSFRPGTYLQGRWVRIDQLTDYAVSSPQRKVAAMLQRGPWSA